MKNGEFEDGTKVLRARIDMSSSNINMRDPILYRVAHMTHHNTGDKWCVYPMYDFAHPIEDAIEGITHSICTLEFEDHRPLYDWVVIECGFKNSPEESPKQIEFAKLYPDHYTSNFPQTSFALVHYKHAGFQKFSLSDFYCEPN